MPLAKRIALLVTGLLCLCGISAGFVFYASVHRALESELLGRLEARMAWIEAALESDGADLEMAASMEPKGAAESWSITTADGRVLWASAGPSDPQNMMLHSRKVLIGDAEGPALEGRELMALEEKSRESWIRKGEAATQKKDGGRRIYRMPIGRYRMELDLTVGTSSIGMQAELHRLTRSLLIVGPLALLTSGLLLSLLIRAQLRPLARMAEQADKIGPGNRAERIGAVGSSAECLHLRGAINSLIARLAEGLQRERLFSASAAHELRTPLAQLRTELEVTLRKDRNKEEYHSALVGMLGDVERLQNLISGLLQLTRSDNPNGFELRPVRLPDLLRKVEERHGPLRISTPQGENELVFAADEELLCSAVSNVLDNASRYAPAEPPTLAVALQDSQAQIVIADRGPGIPDHERERIFHPLTRLDSARSIGQGVEGFGLGLAVARSLARACGGDLFCRGRPDGLSGAEFVFHLPLAAPGNVSMASSAGYGETIRL